MVNAGWIGTGPGVMQSLLAAALVLLAIGSLGLGFHGKAAAAGYQVVTTGTGAAQAKPGAAEANAALAASEAAPEAKAVISAGPQQAVPDGSVEINQLLRLWGVFGAKVGTRCDGLHVGDLRCLSDKGTLATLARFNRPAILVLATGGDSQRVLLSALDETEATLVGANGASRISREQLAALWTGRFEMVWRTNVGMDLLRRGMAGQAVTWLTQRLAQAAEENAHDEQEQAPVSRVFDSAVESRVRNFQLMHGLKPDGLVGPRTQIMLNGIVPEAGVPTLTPQPKTKK